MTRQEFEKVVLSAKRVIAANEARNPEYPFVTPHEYDALYMLRDSLEKAFVDGDGRRRDPV